MKKILCLILCLCCLLTFASCKGSEDKNKNSLDLEYYAKLGQIPEAKFALGADPKAVMDELEGLQDKFESEQKEDPNDTHAHDKEEFYFEYVEGEKNVLLDNGNICYYYSKANKDKGISYIVSYDEGYGFPLGTIITEVKDALNGVEFVEEPLTEDNAFFATYALNGTVLSAEFDNATVLFVFQENELFATAIFNENWIS